MEKNKCTTVIIMLLPLIPVFIYTGKSTVAALLERFYDPNNGVIMLDGLDIQTLDLSWLRGQVIGYINQVRIFFLLCSIALIEDDDCPIALAGSPDW